MSEKMKYEHSCGHLTKNRADMWTHLETCTTKTPAREISIPEPTYTASQVQEEIQKALDERDSFDMNDIVLVPRKPRVVKTFKAYTEEGLAKVKAEAIREAKNAWVEEATGLLRDLPRLEREATDSEVSTPSRERVEGFLYAIEIVLATIKEMKE